MTQLSTQVTSNALSAHLAVQPTMSSREIAELCEKEHKNVKRDIVRLCSEIEISALKFERTYFDVQNKKQTEYCLDKDLTLTLISGYRANLRYAIVKRWDELEKQNSIVIPDFNNPALAARAWAEQYEQRYVAEQQRDHAIATKAEIGSRREATAMATASKEKRRADKLEIELDKSKEWITVKRAEMLCHGQKFNWRELKSTSIEMGYEIKKVFDENYGKINAYHRDVWQETYALDF